MSYTDTFILVAADCPVAAGVVPVARGERKPAHLIQYELLTARPYHYTGDALIFEVHVRHKGIAAREVKARRAAIWAELFSKPHPCLRESALPKRYGWGVHYDRDGKIALYAAGSEEYRRFAAGEGVGKVLPAMRNKRG